MLIETNATLYVVILRYCEDMQHIEPFITEHRAFLDHYYDQGIFIASGMQDPRTGGVILARAPNRRDLWNILKQDPFYREELAEYNIFSFKVTKYAPCFDPVIKALDQS